MENIFFDPPRLNLPTTDEDRFCKDFEATAECYGWALIPNHGIENGILLSISDTMRSLNLLSTEVSFTNSAVLRDPIKDSFSRVDSLVDTILSNIARFLWLQQDWFVEPTQGRVSTLSIIRSTYASENDSGKLSREPRVSSSDLFSLLFSPSAIVVSVTGRSGIQKIVNIPEGTLLILMGEMLQRLTNNVLPASTFSIHNGAGNERGAEFDLLHVSVPFRLDYLIHTLPECGFGTPLDLYPVPVLTSDLIRRSSQ